MSKRLDEVRSALLEAEFLPCVVSTDPLECVAGFDLVVFNFSASVVVLSWLPAVPVLEEPFSEAERQKRKDEALQQIKVNSAARCWEYRQALEGAGFTVHPDRAAGRGLVVTRAEWR